METHAAKDFLAANQGKKLPQLRGDVRRRETWRQIRISLFAGATYSWYDPKTFKGEDVTRGVVHTALVETE